ncbi:hypothetical protein HON22_01595, partial [Candidatus Peregrinibacteria bacterium]|nr:hypothetical protein [Candidatus Peregrinibacteria bacterium]
LRQAQDDNLYEEENISALKLENTLVNSSEYIQSNIAENPSIQERFERHEEEKKEKILSNNESIADQVQDTNKNVVVRLSDFRNPAQVLQDDTKKSLVSASKINRVEYAESSGSKEMSKQQKKKGLKNVVVDRFKKFFGERQAKKLNIGEHEAWNSLVRDRKSKLSDADSYNAAKSKLKKDTARSLNPKIR